MEVDTGPDRFLLQGYLLKRSETLRRWNKRWFSLDPTTAKLEYRAQRGDLYSRGQILFDVNSTITVSPINFNSGSKQYDGCCLYIGTPRKKDYFLAAETPAAARAWVTALRAAMQVLKAHRDAVNAIGDSERRRPTEGAVRAAANASTATAQAMAKEIQAASQKSVLQGFGLQPEEGGPPDDASEDGVMDGTTIMKETLRVKDEELAQMAHDLRARDATIREMADRLSETAEAAEAAAQAAMQMDKDRKAAVSEAAQARRLAESALKEAEARIKEAQESAAKKVKELEASREEAVYRAMQWKAEADRAHEKARALEVALGQVHEGAASAANKDVPQEPTADSSGAPAVSTTPSSKIEAPEKPHGHFESAERAEAPADAETASTAEATTADSSVDDPALSNSSKEVPKAVEAAPNVPQAKDTNEVTHGEQQEGPSADSGEGDPPALETHLESQLRPALPPNLTENKVRELGANSLNASLGPVQNSVEKEKRPGGLDDDTGLDDVPAMDDGFLACYRQGSLGTPTGKDTPDDLH